MTAEAIAARERRVSESETKRFNTTMKEFIEIKYDAIFEEYSTFYKALVEKHPRKRNLLRTSTFMEWKKRVIEESFEKDGVIAEVTNMIPPSDTESESTCEEENLHDQFSEPFELSERRESPCQESVRDQDILSTAITETFPEQHELVNINELENAVSIIDEIIQDLERDEQHELVNINELENPASIIDEIIQDLERDGEVREILEDNINQNADEGIALDYETELDYELELDF